MRQMTRVEAYLVPWKAACHIQVQLHRPRYNPLIQHQIEAHHHRLPLRHHLSTPTPPTTPTLTSPTTKVANATANKNTKARIVKNESLVTLGAKLGLTNPRISKMAEEGGDIFTDFETQRAERVRRVATTDERIHLAVLKEDVEAVRQLLTVLSVDEINSRDAKGNPPLHLAIHLQNRAITELLLEANADISWKNGGGTLAKLREILVLIPFRMVNDSGSHCSAGY